MPCYIDRATFLDATHFTKKFLLQFDNPIDKETFYQWSSQEYFLHAWFSNNFLFEYLNQWED